jgi:hypothetical protein
VNILFRPSHAQRFFTAAAKNAAGFRVTARVVLTRSGVTFTEGKTKNWYNHKITPSFKNSRENTPQFLEPHVKTA